MGAPNPQGSAMLAILQDHNGLGPEYAYIECVKCHAGVRVEGSKDKTHAQLQKQFEAKGWSVTPTRCPQHIGT